jgi:hypothetical protein
MRRMTLVSMRDPKESRSQFELPKRLPLVKLVRCRGQEAANGGGR